MVIVVRRIICKKQNDILVLFSCTVTVMQLDIFTRSVLTKEDYHRTFCTWNIVLVGRVADTFASTQQVEVRVMLFI